MLHCFHLKVIILNLTIYVINLSLCGQLPNQKKKRSPDVKAASTTANETRTFHLRLFNAQRVQRQHKYELNQRYIIVYVLSNLGQFVQVMNYMKILRNNIKQYTMTYSTTCNAYHFSRYVMQTTLLPVINTTFPKWHIYLFYYHCHLKQDFMVTQGQTSAKKYLRSYSLQLNTVEN